MIELKQSELITIKWTIFTLNTNTDCIMSENNIIAQSKETNYSMNIYAMHINEDRIIQ